jgi:hypothetical protein
MLSLKYLLASMLVINAIAFWPQHPIRITHKQQQPSVILYGTRHNRNDVDVQELLRQAVKPIQHITEQVSKPFVYLRLAPLFYSDVLHNRAKYGDRYPPVFWIYILTYVFYLYQILTGVVRLLVSVTRWLADTTDNLVLENIDKLFMEWLDRCIDWSVEQNDNK